MNKVKTVPFEVVEIWCNQSIYAPYTLKPVDDRSVRNFAIKIENEFFLLGGADDAVYICDLDKESADV